MDDATESGTTETPPAERLQVGDVVRIGASGAVGQVIDVGPAKGQVKVRYALDNGELTTTLLHEYELDWEHDEGEEAGEGEAPADPPAESQTST